MSCGNFFLFAKCGINFIVFSFSFFSSQSLSAGNKHTDGKNDGYEISGETQLDEEPTYHVVPDTGSMKSSATSAAIYGGASVENGDCAVPSDPGEAQTTKAMPQATSHAMCMTSSRPCTNTPITSMCFPLHSVSQNIHRIPPRSAYCYSSISQPIMNSSMSSITSGPNGQPPGGSVDPESHPSCGTVPQGIASFLPPFLPRRHPHVANLLVEDVPTSPSYTSPSAHDTRPSVTTHPDGTNIIPNDHLLLSVPASSAQNCTNPENVDQICPQVHSILSPSVDSHNAFQVSF